VTTIAADATDVGNTTAATGVTTTATVPATASAGTSNRSTGR
jgi:hypothetical protein